MKRLFIGGSLDRKIIDLSEDRTNLTHKMKNGLRTFTHPVEETYRQRKVVVKVKGVNVELIVYGLICLSQQTVEQKVREFYE